MTKDKQMCRCMWGTKRMKKLQIPQTLQCICGFSQERFGRLELKMTIIDNYFSLHPFRRCSDTVEQRTWIHSVSLSILVPFTFCLFCLWSADLRLFYNCLIFFPAWGKHFKCTNNAWNPFETLTFFSYLELFMHPKKKYQYVVRVAFLLVHWSLQLWNPLQDNNLKFLWQRFGFLMPKHFLDLVFT